jgi:D-serine dehydratase
MMMDLSEIENSVVDGRTKGMPADARPQRLGDIGRNGWSVLSGELPLPLAVIRQSALTQNSRWMRAYLAHSGAKIAPHGKTTMAPQLFARQLDDGAWAITVASVQQLKVARDFGVTRAVLANQLEGSAEIRYVLAELKRDASFSFLCFVDSIENVAELAAAARAASLPRPLDVLLEVGFSGGRTGCRTADHAHAVARAVKDAAPYLALRGVAGFEGLISGATPAEAEAGVDRFIDFIGSTAAAVDAARLFADGPVILTAGGSGYFDVVVDRLSTIPLSRPVEVVIRSGCYLTHDGHMYRDLFGQLAKRHPELGALGPGLTPALQVWARVQSRPEPGKVILAVGKRDISYDVHLPAPALWHRDGMDAPTAIPAGHIVTGLNDQHCHMSVPADSPLRVGDRVGFDISHPCTTFDKWQLLHIVDDSWRVVGALRTFF